MANTAPIISATVEDTNSATVYLTTGKTSGTSFTLIKYHSNALAKMVATPQSGATINEDTYVIRNGSRIGYGASCVFEGAENNVFTFSAEDNRGLAGTRTITATMIDYVRLTCNIGNNRPDTSGNMTLTCSGNFFNGSFGAVSNSLSVRFTYECSDGSSGAGTMKTTISDDTYTASATLSGLDYQASYSFYITAEDELETVTSSTYGVKSKPVYHWGEKDFTFEVPVTFNGDDTTVFKKNVRLKGDGNFGNILYFGDGSYCSISEPEDDMMEIKASTLNLNVSTLLLNDEEFSGSSGFSGSWTPILDSSVVHKYYVRKGWYLKLGDVVVIGWYVRASIETASHQTEVTINGAPYDPSESAFGGGVAYNIYVPAGFNFEGWGIDTNAEITARLQPCNETSAGDLEIASSAGYPSAGGTITLAGTICYTTV